MCGRFSRSEIARFRCRKRTRVWSVGPTHCSSCRGFRPAGRVVTPDAGFHYKHINVRHVAAALGADVEGRETGSAIETRDPAIRMTALPAGGFPGGTINVVPGSFRTWWKYVPHSVPTLRQRTDKPDISVFYSVFSFCVYFISIDYNWF